MTIERLAVLCAVAIAFIEPAVARAEGAAAAPERNVYFGELHLHTSYSLDSYLFGNRNDPTTAYRFGRGEAVTLYGGEKKQLKHPLDFMAVTDHAEYMGEIALCTMPGNPAYDGKMCDGVRRGDQAAFQPIVESVSRPERRHVAEICGEDGSRCREAAKGTWKRLRDAAASFYQPGKFTTLLGFEYSPSIPTADGHPYVPGTVPGMLHRNVIFRTDHVPDNVFSSYDGSAEQLQAWLDADCREPCRVLDIPHNSNYSWGRFFWEKNSDGSPWTKEILDRKVRMEPLIEIFQIKGGSECQAGIGLTDEECGFENSVPACKPGQTEACAMPTSFVRDGLVKGLAVQDKWGLNPFKYGIVGGTDNHDALSTSTDESSYTGAHGQMDNTPAKRLATRAPMAQGRDPDGDDAVSMLRFNPGGLTGVWAEQNTRESIWDALYRKETFGTSGTRIRVRFFGSFDFPRDLHKSPDLVKIGYAKGVPMGGDLKSAPAGKAPVFVASATRDPDSAPLQKIQIIKGWVQNGVSRSKTYDIVCSDGIKPDPETGRCADNGATVDIATCKVGAGKGAGELATTWIDPSFDPKSRAVYYVRVLEDPTCRWSTWDAHRLNVDPPKSVPATIKERAWSSPIWYSP
ncbi:MAG TPA: DUF3604 domain-containing protein [Alphaproteobacteria bacterium]|nr:DUF3604 domain-containing protein [Alphaproteobacteria bacterium]